MFDVKNEVEKYYSEAVELLEMLVSHKSVLDKSTSTSEMPYGKGCADCLKSAEEYLKEKGFITKNFDNYAITATFDDREAELGVLAHLDVVPEGEGWKSNPFALTKVGGKLVGRGAIDDKGPTAAVITAMRILKENGVELKKNMRLVLGSDEENGSSDMEYYLTKEKFPPMLFTPDGNFPIITAEKGMIRCYIDIPNVQVGDKKIKVLKGGTAVNAVPERVEVTLEGVSKEELTKAYMASAGYIKDVVKYSSISFKGNENGDVTVIIKGKSAHASTPDSGENAISILLMFLHFLGFGENYTNLANSFQFGRSNGVSLKINCYDSKSGKLTIVPSVIALEGDTIRLDMDIRVPVTKTTEEVISKLRDSMGAYGFDLNVYMQSEPHCVDEESDFIKTLLSVYEDVTGKAGKCLAIGGGTYVHDTENGVAFGAEWEGSDNHMHGADEFITEEEFKKDIELYTEALLRLCC